MAGRTFTAPEESFFAVNSFQTHELQAEEPALILALQISPDFFAAYFPQIRTQRFGQGPVLRESSPGADKLFRTCLACASEYLRKPPLYELRCAAYLNEIAAGLLCLLPGEVLSERQMDLISSRQRRIRLLTDAVDSRCTGKLLLGDLARELHVSVFYLSHFFTENFGMPFQEYLSRVRFEKARRMLLLTDRSLLDICLASGFSDQKYFNRDFEKLYGAKPKEYRASFRNAPLPLQQQSVLTTQEFLSREAGLVMLDKWNDGRYPLSAGSML